MSSQVPLAVVVEREPPMDADGFFEVAAEESIAAELRHSYRDVRLTTFGGQQICIARVLAVGGTRDDGFAPLTLRRLHRDETLR